MKRFGRFTVHTGMVLLLLLALFAFVGTNVHAETALRTATPEEEEKLEAIVSEMRSENITGQLEQAVWLHNWLTTHATYANDDSEYKHEPAGVLIHGKGVCQSYTDSYRLLLDKVGIENTVIESPAMDHTTGR